MDRSSRPGDERRQRPSADLRPLCASWPVAAMTRLAWTQDTRSDSMLPSIGEDCALVFDTRPGWTRRPRQHRSSDARVQPAMSGSDVSALLRVGIASDPSRGRGRRRDSPEHGRSAACHPARSVCASCRFARCRTSSIQEAIDSRPVRGRSSAAFGRRDARRRPDRRGARAGARAAGPIEIRAGHFVPAVEFIQANRFRMRVMQQLDEAFGDLDSVHRQQPGVDQTASAQSSRQRAEAGAWRDQPTAQPNRPTGKLFGEAGDPPAWPTRSSRRPTSPPVSAALG